MRAAASLILRSARLPRCPLPPLLSSITVWGPGGHQAPTAAERSAASATSLAWFSSRSHKTGSTAALPDGVGDVTKIFGDSSFWEGEYASQVLARSIYVLRSIQIAAFDIFVCFSNTISKVTHTLLQGQLQ